MIGKKIRGTMEGLRWNRLSIRHKLFAIYFLIIVIPVVTLGLYLTRSLSGSFTRNIELTNRATIDLIVRGFKARIANHLEIIDSLAYNDRLIRFLKTDFRGVSDAYGAYKDGVAELFKAAESREKATLYRILTNNRSIGFSGRFITDPGLAGVGRLRQDADARKITWDGIATIGGSGYLVCHTPMKVPSIPTETVATLFTYLSCDNLALQFDDFRSVRTPIFILDGEGRVVVSNADFPPPSAGDGRHAVSTAGGRYLLQSERIHDEVLYLRDWRILYLTPLDLVDSNVRRIWLITLCLVAFSVLSTVAIITPFSRGLTGQIFDLIRSMREFESGNRKTRASSRYRDEIGQLISIFNAMADTIDHLITETLEAKISVQQVELERARMENARNEARLQYLQSTINPHYLFNTLESIRMRTLLNGDRRTSRIIRVFAQTFRELMSSTDSMVAIRQELDLVEAFFTVQKYRFGRRLQCSSSCDPGIRDLKIPRFSLQPLVENAISHGLEKKAGKGEVRLAVSLCDGWIDIRVTDNGLGMAPDGVKELEALVKSPDGSGMRSALQNIYQRLALIYGGRFRFEISSALGSGTSVLIRMPRG